MKEYSGPVDWSLIRKLMVSIELLPASVDVGTKVVFKIGVIREVFNVARLLRIDQRLGGLRYINVI